MKKMIVYTVLGCLLCSCGKTEKLPTFPENPGCEAYEGFIWEKVEQNGLKFWAQKNAQIKVRTNAEIPGAEIAWQDRPQSGRTVMRLFYLPPVQTINPKRVKGTLILAHEIRSFRDVDTQKEYWVIDQTGQLYARYDSLTQGIKNGTPVEAELCVKEAEHRTDGFAADYTGTYHIIKIINLKETEK